MFFQQLLTNTHRKNRIISWINTTMNNNEDHYFHAQLAEKLSTQKFKGENRFTRKSVFNSSPFSAWKRPFVTTLVINKVNGCLALDLMLPWAKTSASAFR